MYNSLIRNHINSIIGNCKLKDIKPIHIQEIFNQKQHLSQSLNNKIKITLKQIIESAVNNELIFKSPVIKIQTSCGESEPKEALTPEETETLLQAIAGHRAEPFIKLLLYTGLRRGEALALTWKAIDLENKTVTVSKSILYKNNKPGYTIFI